jgi:hypothetical protein
LPAPFHARTREDSFTVVFYGSKTFCCKTAQFCVTQREPEMAETSLGNGAQADEKPRKKPLLNYESAARTA